MSIAPDRLDGVSADVRDAGKLEGLRRQRTGGIFINVPHDVLFPLASGARTMTAQEFERDETLAAIVPFDGQFGADALQIDWMHETSKHFNCGLLDTFRSPDAGNMRISVFGFLS